MILHGDCEKIDYGNKRMNVENSKSLGKNNKASRSSLKMANIFMNCQK